MYCPTLDLFRVPDVPHWPEAVRYYPEPPVAPRGAFNPWQLERNRQVYAAEEKAWASIQTLGREYKARRVESETLLTHFNRAIAEVESLTGKKTGMSASSVASLVATVSGNPIWGAAMGIKFLVDMFMGSQKKKKIERAIREAERVQALLVAAYQRMEAIAGEVSMLVRVGESIRSEQQATASAIEQYSERAYQQRQSLERQRAAAHRVQAEIALRTVPIRQGGSDVL